MFILFLLMHCFCVVSCTEFLILILAAGSYSNVNMSGAHSESDDELYADDTIAVDDTTAADDTSTDAPRGS